MGDSLWAKQEKEIICPIINGSICRKVAMLCYNFSDQKRRDEEEKRTFVALLGLSVNVKKTKIMVFNKRGLGPNHFKTMRFFAGGFTSRNS